MIAVIPIVVVVAAVGALVLALLLRHYHRIDPPSGFALQRVYAGDGNLDETLAVRDRDVVLVPRGEWAVANDPDHEWMLKP